MIADHRHYSARVLVRRRADVLQVDYSGVISLETVDLLERRVLPERRHARVVLERIDQALTLFAGPVTLDAINYPSWTPPAAVIARADQYQRSSEFCRLLALRGLVRVTFLPCQLAWAQAFVARVAARQSQGRSGRR